MPGKSKTILYYRTVPEKGDGWRALTAPLSCPMWPGYSGPPMPDDFEWDGNSSSLFAPIFPKWNHPIASARHDFRCRQAKNAQQRKWADKEYQKDVGTTGWWITKKLGYIGVRVGALLGVGVRY
jgi:hypothetical protein